MPWWSFAKRALDRLRRPPEWPPRLQKPNVSVVLRYTDPQNRRHRIEVELASDGSAAQVRHGQAPSPSSEDWYWTLGALPQEAARHLPQRLEHLGLWEDNPLPPEDPDFQHLRLTASQRSPSGRRYTTIAEPEGLLAEPIQRLRQRLNQDQTEQTSNALVTYLRDIAQRYANQPYDDSPPPPTWKEQTEDQLFHD